MIVPFKPLQTKTLPVYQLSTLYIDGPRHDRVHLFFSPFFPLPNRFAVDSQSISLKYGQLVMSTTNSFWVRISIPHWFDSATAAQPAGENLGCCGEPLRLELEMGLNHLVYNFTDGYGLLAYGCLWLKIIDLHLAGLLQSVVGES